MNPTIETVERLGISSAIIIVTMVTFFPLIKLGFNTWIRIVEAKAQASIKIAEQEAEAKIKAAAQEAEAKLRAAEKQAAADLERDRQVLEWQRESLARYEDLHAGTLKVAGDSLQVVSEFRGAIVKVSDSLDRLDQSVDLLKERIDRRQESVPVNNDRRES